MWSVMWHPLSAARRLTLCGISKLLLDPSLQGPQLLSAESVEADLGRRRGGRSRHSPAPAADSADPPHVAGVQLQAVNESRLKATPIRASTLIGTSGIACTIRRISS